MSGGVLCLSASSGLAWSKVFRWVGPEARAFFSCLSSGDCSPFPLCVRCVAEINILRLVHITLRPLASTMFGV